MNLICVPASHVVRRDSLEYFLENLCVAFCGGHPQSLELVGKRVCNLEIFLGLGVNLMRTRNGGHATSDLAGVGETGLRLDEPKVLWFLVSLPHPEAIRKSLPLNRVRRRVAAKRATRYGLPSIVDSITSESSTTCYEGSMRARLHLIIIPGRFHCHHHLFENGH